MSFAHFSCLSTGSTESPMILTFLRSNSGLILAMYPSSVVQTGVKSFGCENSTTHESPAHSWKLIGPSLVWALKSGASEPIDSPILTLLSFGGTIERPRQYFKIYSELAPCACGFGVRFLS